MSQVAVTASPTENHWQRITVSCPSCKAPTFAVRRYCDQSTLYIHVDSGKWDHHWDMSGKPVPKELTAKASAKATPALVARTSVSVATVEKPKLVARVSAPPAATPAPEVYGGYICSVCGDRGHNKRTCKKK